MQQQTKTIPSMKQTNTECGTRNDGSIIDALVVCDNGGKPIGGMRLLKDLGIWG
jgi:hypothetical protein